MLTNYIKYLSFYEILILCQKILREAISISIIILIEINLISYITKNNTLKGPNCEYNNTRVYLSIIKSVETKTQS